MKTMNSSPRFGDIRALLAQSPTSARWYALMRLLIDACRDDGERALETYIPYISQSVQRWPDHTRPLPLSCIAHDSIPRGVLTSLCRAFDLRGLGDATVIMVRELVEDAMHDPSRALPTLTTLIVEGATCARWSTLLRRDPQTFSRLLEPPASRLLPNLQTLRVERLQAPSLDCNTRFLDYSHWWCLDHMVGELGEHALRRLELLGAPGVSWDGWSLLSMLPLQDADLVCTGVELFIPNFFAPPESPKLALDALSFDTVWTPTTTYDPHRGVCTRRDAREGLADSIPLHNLRIIAHNEAVRTIRLNSPCLLSDEDRGRDATSWSAGHTLFFHE